MPGKTQDTKTRILQATCELLASSPGVAARMSDIAKHAGVSRQALYLHFPNRTELFIAATRHLDQISNIEDRLRPSRTATSGHARLEAFIEAWGNYIPRIFGMSKTLMTLKATDTEAAAAWDTRMQDMREGCAAAVQALVDDGALAAHLTCREATDLLWTLLSVPVWDALTQSCGWSQESYIEHVKNTARRTLTRG